ncbi:hypothetical protein AAIH25_07140 [Arthrobacter crystallopoietes]|uniref:hypothetical protein n=1 Tax=Crystallibacter crystallopoietes TaxID=37928 RepID=UPI003D1C6259
MILGRRPAARLVARFLLAVTAAVMTAFVAVFALHYAVPLEEAKAFVDIGAESNLPTWWNASLLFLTAVLAAAAAVAADPGRPRLAFGVVAAAAAYLSVDETAGLHERLARPMLAAGVETPTYPWLILGTAMGLLGAAVLCLAGRALPREIAPRLALALACYAGGALGVEAINGSLREGGPGILFSAGLMLEEGLEMTACIIAVAAMADHLSGMDTRRSLVEQVAGH